MTRIVLADQSFAGYDELINVVRAGFALQDGVVSPPSSALSETAETLRRRD